MIFYESQNLKQHEKNYATHNLELQMIVHALKVWRNYVIGKKFELQTKHLSLKYLFDQQKLNTQHATWLEFLCEFRFDIKHVKENENKVVDSLSRKSHMESISMSQTNLIPKIHKAFINDKFSLQVK